MPHAPLSSSPGSHPGVVSAAFPDAAEAGAAMLRAGGNAIDAACAAAWALSVCEPAESGLGGQTTMLVRLADGRTLVIDGHSRAPASLTRKAVKRKAQGRGIRSTTIPSTPATLASAQTLLGRLTIPQALAPAIALARDGYRITRLQRRLLKWTVPHWSPSSPEAAIFLKGGAAPYSRGDLFRQPLLARTLERLAHDGVDDFYKGRMAREIVADMAARAGLISATDLRDLALPVQREPLVSDYRGRRVLSIPPPGGGTQVLLALRILEPLLDSTSDEGHWVTMIAEATLAAFRERERWPDHPEDMTPSLARWLVSRERAERLIKQIRERAPGDPVPPDSLGESGNTTHLCAADIEGNVVALTQSIQSVFGSKVAHPTLGFVYNNYLSACPRTPHPYRLGPGSLPQSNAAPTLLLDASGRPELVLGSAGSRRITSSVVQVISAVVDRGLPVAQAVALPRAHVLLNRTVWMEASMPVPMAAAMRARFPKIRERAAASYKLGAVQAIAWERPFAASGGSSGGVGGVAGVCVGAADPRRDGSVSTA